MQTFQDMGLNSLILKNLGRLNFTTPTPIQKETIPFALEKRDILGSAQTGTGKTLAFAIPLVNKLLEDPKAQALVLTPTRELALQVAQSIKQLLPIDSPIKSALLIGGEAMPKQLQQLKSGARIIVGTPGRVIDHTERRTLNLAKINFFVLDEADRMFDMGFGEQLDHIISRLPEDRQNLMFSATFAPEIVKLATKHLNNPERISVDQVSSASPLIKQEMLEMRDGDKFDTLLEQLDNREGSIIIFVKTKIGAEKLATKLNAQDYGASAIHGDLRQHKRIKVINDFKRGKQRIMVATDVAARGLDVPDIRHVINYDLPQCPDDYIHRIGRTGRAGVEGHAVCFVTPQDTGKWRAIYRLMNPGEKLPDMPKHGGKGHEGRRNKPGMGRKHGDKPFGKSFDRSSGSSPFGRDKSRHNPTRVSFDRPERSFDRSDRTHNERDAQKRFARDMDGDRRSFDRRDEGDRRPLGRRDDSERRSFGRRDEGDRRPSGRRDFDDRRPSERNSSERSGDRRGGFKSFEDRPRFNSDKPFGGGRDSNRSFGDRSGPKGGKPFGKKPFGQKRDTDNYYADRAPQGDRRKSFEGSPSRGKTQGGGMQSGKTFFRAESPRAKPGKKDR